MYIGVMSLQMSRLGHYIYLYVSLYAAGRLSICGLDLLIEMYVNGKRGKIIILSFFIVTQKLICQIVNR